MCCVKRYPGKRHRYHFDDEVKFLNPKKKEKKNDLSLSTLLITPSDNAHSVCDLTSLKLPDLNVAPVHSMTMTISVSSPQPPLLLLFLFGLFLFCISPCLFLFFPFVSLSLRTHAPPPGSLASSTFAPQTKPSHLALPPLHLPISFLLLIPLPVLSLASS